MFRPGRQLAVVGSLELWKQALARMDRSILSRTRKLSPAWLCLLVGALAAALALAGPVYRASPPGRQVAVAIIPSAELGDAKALRQEVNRFLDRLSPADRVQLLLPTVLPQGPQWTDPSGAKAAVGQIDILPMAARDVRLHPAIEPVQHTYYFATQGANVQTGPGVTLIPLPAALPPMTIDAIGARDVAGKMQLLVAVRSHIASAAAPSVVVRQAGSANPVATKQLTVGPGGRGAAVFDLPPADGVEVTIDNGGAVGGLGAGAFVVLREARRVKVALIGPDEPLVRRFVAVNPAAELVEANDAELVIANQVRPPEGVPAIVINPAEPPAGWGRGETISDVSLAKAQLAADHSVMQGLELAGVVRRLRPWAPAEGAEGKVLARLGDDAIILLQEGSAASANPLRRVYVAFDVSAANCTWSLNPSFVMFLAGALEYLAPAGKAQAEYEYQQPLAAGPWREWTRMAGEGDGAQSPLASPGLYRDAAGQLHAVSLVGLQAEPSAASGPSPAPVVLPDPRPIERDVEFWPMLAGLAAAFWLAGWFLRTRE